MEEQQVIRKKKIKIDHRQTFGKVLQQYMKRDRWTGADLSREVGCTRNHISEILSGKCYPSFSLGQKIASVFGCELGWRRLPSAPKSPKKKKEPVLIEPKEESMESNREDASAESKKGSHAAPGTKSSNNGASAAQEKIKRIKELQGKASASRKEAGDNE